MNSDIEIITAASAVKKRPDMYIRPGDVNTPAVQFAAELLAHGAENVSIVRSGDIFTVTADKSNLSVEVAKRMFGELTCGMPTPPGILVTYLVAIRALSPMVEYRNDGQLIRYVNGELDFHGPCDEQTPRFLVDIGGHIKGESDG